MKWDYRDKWPRHHAALIITCKWLEEDLRLTLFVTVTVIAVAGTAPCQQPLELPQPRAMLELPIQFKGCWSGTTNVTGQIVPQKMKLCFEPAPRLEASRPGLWGYRITDVRAVGAGSDWVQMVTHSIGQKSIGGSFVSVRTDGNFKCRARGEQIACDGSSITCTDDDVVQATGSWTATLDKETQ